MSQASQYRYIFTFHFGATGRYYPKFKPEIFFSFIFGEPNLFLYISTI